MLLRQHHNIMLNLNTHHWNANVPPNVSIGKAPVDRCKGSVEMELQDDSTPKDVVVGSISVDCDQDSSFTDAAVGSMSHSLTYEDRVDAMVGGIDIESFGITDSSDPDNVTEVIGIIGRPM